MNQRIERHLPIVNGLSRLLPEVLDRGTLRIDKDPDDQLNVCNRSRPVPDCIICFGKGFSFFVPGISPVNGVDQADHYEPACQGMQEYESRIHRSYFIDAKINQKHTS